MFWAFFVSVAGHSFVPNSWCKYLDVDNARELPVADLKLPQHFVQRSKFDWSLQRSCGSITSIFNDTSKYNYWLSTFSVSIWNRKRWGETIFCQFMVSLVSRLFAVHHESLFFAWNQVFSECFSGLLVGPSSRAKSNYSPWLQSFTLTEINKREIITGMNIYLILWQNEKIDKKFTDIWASCDTKLNMLIFSRTKVHSL